MARLGGGPSYGDLKGWNVFLAISKRETNQHIKKSFKREISKNEFRWFSHSKREGKTPWISVRDLAFPASGPL